MPVSDPAATTSGALLRAFVLDDDPEYADTLADVLSFVGGGPKTWTTTSAEAARRRLARETYDVIVMSLESGGERLLVDLRRSQPAAVILVTSGASMTARQVSGQFAAGADDVVQKPFHPSEFVARVNRLLRIRAQVPSNAASVTPASLAQV